MVLKWGKEKPEKLKGKNMKNITKQQDDIKLQISSSPQINHSQNSSKIMWTVVAVLLPASMWGVFVFGLSSLIVLLVSLITAVLSEYSVNLLVKRKTLKDGSAVLTGLLIGMNMPPELPLYIPVTASMFAILIVKWTFGGLGKNWANPAIAGRVFAFLSYSGHMMTWKMPSFPWNRSFFTNVVNVNSTSASISASDIASYDSVTGATPLGMIKDGVGSLTELQSDGSIISGPVDLIHKMVGDTGYHISGVDIKITNWFNSLLNIDFKAGFFDPLLGLVPGSIGEISALLLLLGAGVLFVKKIIRWEIPLAFIGTFALLVWVFGGLRYDQGFFSGNIWYQVMTGGLILGAFFMATDMVTSPLTSLGMLLFGFGIGLLTYLVRFHGNYPEGVSLAILFMNMLVPLLDRYIKPRKFGFVKKQKRKK